jgi:hypothetical protein
MKMKPVAWPLEVPLALREIFSSITIGTYIREDGSPAADAPIRIDLWLHRDRNAVTGLSSDNVEWIAGGAIICINNNLSIEITRLSEAPER